ncbi:unnamed protein product [Lactuca saligna]|uniref:Uncharacterized protein n=1 Tax=Lactuca saligna TaxID=75948 RepID=A0AA35ZPV8_LACSI|nr:unnamed protein product [Lactuca saligna]
MSCSHSSHLTASLFWTDSPSLFTFPETDESLISLIRCTGGVSLMFASQLLRILQTFPTNVNNEICNFDTDEVKEKNTMKESPKRTFVLMMESLMMTSSIKV